MSCFTTLETLGLGLHILQLFLELPAVEADFSDKIHLCRVLHKPAIGLLLSNHTSLL